MTPSPASVVIAAGGTGGHIYPGLALAAALRQRQPDVRITFVGTARGMEGELVPAAGHNLRLYTMAQFNNQGLKKSIVPAAIARGTRQARSILRSVGADAAVSMGGYAGVPLILGARVTGVPAIVFEPGAVPGQANRLAVRFCRNVATAFPGTPFAGRAPRVVGYPLQAHMTGFDREALRGGARAALGIAEGHTLVFVTGGSQGARSLNQLALGLAERWAGRDDIHLLVKTGARTHDETAAALEDNPGRERVELVRYIDHIDHAYAAADLAISRSGAGSVSELAAAGLPAVLVPLAGHEHDEQLYNANVLVNSGGALLVRDREANADVVGPLVEPLLTDPSALGRMRAALAGVARPDAAMELADWVLSLAGRAVAA